MPDVKYSVRLPDGKNAVLDQQQYENIQGDLFNKFPEAQVSRVTSYIADDEDDDRSDQFRIDLPDGKHSVLDHDQFDKVKDNLFKKFPEAKVHRISDMAARHFEPMRQEAKTSLAEFDEKNGAFMHEYEFNKSVADILDTDGVMVSDQHNYIKQNEPEYERLSLERRNILKDYFNNPITQREFRDKAAIAKTMSDEYRAKIAEASDGYERRDWRRAAKMMDDMRKIYEAPSDHIEGLDEENGFLDYLGAYKQGAVDKFTDRDFLTRGISKISRNLDVRGAMQKLQDERVRLGHELSEQEIDKIISPSERAELLAFAQLAIAQKERAEDIASAYNAGTSFADSIGFMAEFLLSQGMANVAGKALTGSSNAFAQWLGRNLMSNQAVNRLVAKGVMEAPKFTSTAAKLLNAATVKPLVQGLWHTGTQLSTLASISDGLTQIGDNGKLVSAWRAIGNGVLDSIVENYSESFGQAIDLGMDKAFAAMGYGRDAVLGKGGIGRFARWMFDSKPSQVFKEAGFNGILSEMLEEWVGNAARVGLGLMSGDEFKDFASMKQQLEMAASFAPLSLFGLGSSTMAAVRNSKKSKELAGEIMGIMRGNGFSDEQINDVFNTRFDTASDIADKLAPVLQSLRAKGESAEDDYKKVLDFAGTLSKDAVANETKRLEDEAARNSMREEIQNVSGKFWTDVQAEGEEAPRQVVNVITYADGSQKFIIGRDGDTIQTVDRNGKRGFTSQKDIDSGVESGAIASVQESSLDEYVEGEVQKVKTEDEARRMSEERQQTLATLKKAFPAGQPVTVGTEEAQIPMIVAQQNDNGIVLVDDLQKPTATREISWAEAAALIGIPFNVKTDAQLEQEIADQYDAAEKRKEDYNATLTPGTEITVDMELDGENKTPVKFKFNKAVTEEGQVILYVTDEDGNETTLTEDQAMTEGDLGLVMEGAESVEPVQQQEESEQDKEEQAADVVSRFTDQTTGEVDETGLWNESPEDWCRWNDSQRNDNGADSIEYVNGAIKRLQAQQNKLITARRNEADFKKRKELEASIGEKGERITRLQAIVADYAHKEEQAKAAAKAQERLVEQQMNEPQNLEHFVAQFIYGQPKGSLNREDWQRETGKTDEEMSNFFAYWAKKGTGKTVKQLAEEIAEHDDMGFVPMDQSGADQKDSAMVRSVIIDLMRRAVVPSDLGNMTRSDNEAAARREEEYYGNAQEEAPVVEETPAAETEQPEVVEEQAAEPVAEEVPEEVPVENPVQQAVAEAREEVDTNPTDAQKEAGNYRKGHVTIDGYDITIENPKGSVRSGKDASGKEWRTEMHNDYGYIRGTKSVDGDQIDVFLSDNPAEGNVFVIDQVNPSTGEFDEHKVMYGFNSAEEARAAYLSNYEEGWQGLGTITEVTKDEFRKWIDSSNRKTKPFSEYKSVKAEGAQNEEVQQQENEASAEPVQGTLAFTEEQQQTADKVEAFIEGKTPEEVAAERKAAEGVKEEVKEEKPADTSSENEASKKVQKAQENAKKLLEAYKSGDKDAIKKAEKAVADYINQSSSVSLLMGTANTYKNRRRAEKKDSPSYKMYDFIVKTAEKRLKSIGKLKDAQNAQKTYSERFTASKDELESAIAFYEGELEQVKKEMPGQGKGLEGMINGLRMELRRFEKAEEEIADDSRQDELERQKPLQERIAKWKSLLGDIFEVLTGDEGIDNKEASDAIANGETVRGWYETGSGKAALYLPHIKDLAELDRTILHEVLSHKGIRAIFQNKEDLNKFLDKVWEEMSKKAKDEMLDYVGTKFKTEAERQRAAADEYVAHVAENNTSVIKEFDETAWTKIVDAVKRFIEDMLGADIWVENDDFGNVLRDAIAVFAQEEAKRREADARDLMQKQGDLLSAVEGETTPAVATAQTAANPQVPISRSQEKYEDFGNKIGEARKDTALPTGKKGESDGRPAWAKKYSTSNIKMLSEDEKRLMSRLGSNRNFQEVINDITKGTDYSQPFVGFWDETIKTAFGNRTRRHYITDANRNPIIFSSREQYEAVMPVFEAMSQRFHVIERDGKAIIVRAASNGKQVEYASFDKKEDAVAYLATPEGATELLNRKRENYELPALSSLTRNGMPDYRNGRNVTPDDILKTFGFYGGEFGNWLNADERQQFLNLAYDSLMDLASIIGVTPRALSLGGALSIAFGARGRGGDGAAAHYEPGRVVINLTKMKGAGSLAHEWAHALDNYFGMMAAKKTIERGNAEHNREYLSAAGYYAPGVRKEIRDAINKLMTALTKKEVTREIAVDKAQEQYDGMIDYARRQLQKHYREDFVRGIQKYQYNRKTKTRDVVTIKPTEEQIAKFDELCEKLLTDPTFEFYWETMKGGFRAKGDVAEQLYDLVKDVMPNRAGSYGPLHNAFYYLDKAMPLKERLEKAKKGEKETVTVETTFYEDSKWFDRDRAGEYWTKDIEMFARAFESVVAEKMKREGKSSDYLTYLKGPLYQAAWEHNPYPAGEEMETAIKAFDNLFDTIQEKEDENGNAVLFSRVYHGSGADFDLFDHSHMGEGEGSQVYGWGTYVTTNKETGRQYAVNLGGNSDIIEKTISEVKEKAANATGPKEKKQYKDDLAFWNERLNSIIGNRHLYTVEIPDDNGQNYIHWEKPLTVEQSQKIMDAIRERVNPEEWGDEFEYELQSALGYGTYGRHVEGGLDYFLGNMYDYATDKNPGAERNAKLLNSLGIVGFEIPIDLNGGKKYEGSNYVIFNEDDLKIVEHTRFSKIPVRGKDEKPNDYLRRCLDYIEDKYNIVAKGEFNYDWKEGLDEADYDEVKDIVRIFATEEQGFNNYENSFFHENLHAFITKNVEDKAFVDEFVSAMDKSRVADKFAKLKKVVDEKTKEEWQRPTEYFVHSVANAMGAGQVNFLLEDVPESSKSVIDKYLKAIGYDQQRERDERKQRANNDSGSVRGRGASVPELRVDNVAGEAEGNGENVSDSGIPGEGVTRFSKVTDQKLIDELEAGEKETGYRNVVMNDDGTMGSPMASKLGKKGAKPVKTAPFAFNEWEQSEENPDMATEDGKINLGKPDGLGNVDGVDYNPYIHIRPTLVNRQFTGAWKRDNLVYIETQYPASELTSGYKAEKAAKSVGRHAWNGGDLILSRYDKPVRVVPWEEVADDWMKESNITFDIVPPGLLPVLASRGVEILPPKKAAGKDAMAAYESWRNNKETRFSRDMAAQKQPGAEYPDGDELLNETRFSLSKNNRNTIEAWMRKRNDISKETKDAVVRYLDTLDNPTLQLATAKWFCQGVVRLPEDMPKIEQAVSVAGKAKVDPLQYDSPMALLEAHANFTATEKRINPDEVNTLHRITEIPEAGIVIYKVDESDESRENMRKIINTHFGKEASPWCLLQGDGNGNLTPDSKRYWNHYNAYKKKVAFKDGKLLAFSANNSDDEVWWDRSDEPNDGIPVKMKIEGDELGRSGTYLYFSDGRSAGPENVFRGNQQNGVFERWFDNGRLAVRKHYKDGQEEGLIERWFDNGQFRRRYNIKDGDPEGLLEEWYESGQQKERSNYKNGVRVGLSEGWWSNGNPRWSGEFSESGLQEGEHKLWHDNGQLSALSHYKNGKFVGEQTSWFENGNMREHSTYNESGHAEGVAERWWGNGILAQRRTYKDDNMVGKEERFYETGNPRLIIYRNERGANDGEETIFNLDGTVFKKTYWNDGHREADVTFYKNGNEREKIAYDSNGNVLYDLEWNEDGTPITGSTRFSKANANQAIFVSNAEQAVNGIPMDKATPQQWVKMIEGRGGLKAGEDKWIGLSEWLRASDKKTITKQEVLDYIDENKIRIEEVHYSENGDDMAIEKAHPGFTSAFYLDEDEFRDEVTLGGVANLDAAVELYNNEHEDKIAIDNDDDSRVNNPGGRISNEDWDRLLNFGESLVKNGKAAFNSINSTRLDYTTEGLDNKREIALTVPTIEPWNESDRIHFGDAGGGRAIAWARFGDAWKEGELMTNEEKEGLPESYKNRDIRLKPSRVLFIDEIQSKRHQEAREKGYKNEAKIAESSAVVKQMMKDYGISIHGLEEEIKNAERDAVAKINSLYYSFQTRFPNGWTKEEEFEQNGFPNKRLVPDPAIVGEDDADWYARQSKKRDKAIEDLDKLNKWKRSVNGIPGAPFEKNWHELAMKRMLRLAAEEGYDYVAWTTGEQQAERYDIGNVVDSIGYDEPFTAPHEVAPSRYFVIRLKDGTKIHGRVFTDGEYKGIVQETFENSYGGKPLSDVVGKAIANEIIGAEGDGELKGEGLRIGASGMMGFYDKMLPEFMNKYGKKWGVKVEDINLRGLERGGITAHAVKVTPEMKESVMAGQTMFSKEVDSVDKEGIGALIGKENVSTFYNDIYKSIAPEIRDEIVSRAEKDGWNLHGGLRQYLSDKAAKGYENDETGILRLAGLFLNDYMEEPLDEKTLRYVMWRAGQPNDMLTDILAENNKRRWGIGEETRFSRAYHGTGANFDEFKLSNAGSGEGNWAHGYGIYVAMNEDVAKMYARAAGNYDVKEAGRAFWKMREIEAKMAKEDTTDIERENLKQQRQILLNLEQILQAQIHPKNIDSNSNLTLEESWKILDAVSSVARWGDVATAIEQAKNYLTPENKGNATYEMAEYLTSTKPEDWETNRHVYEVEIPDDNGENYIDEMKTLAKPLRKKVADVVRQIPEERLDRNGHGPSWLPNGFETLANIIEREQYAGLEIRDRLVDALGNTLDAQKETSKILHDAGFVGMKYVGSRDRECAVIFDDKDVKVVNHTQFSKGDLSSSLNEKSDEAKQKVDNAAAALEINKKSLRGDLLTAAKAMAVQKDYDKYTIETITNLAKELLKDNTIDALNRREIARILGVIRTSVGKSPRIVKNNTDALVGIIVDHLLKREVSAYNSLIRSSGTKLNATGVEVQGNLDVRGQNVLKAYKAGLDMEIGKEDDDETVNSIYGHLQVLSDRMENPDDSIRKEAEDEHEGLALALEYKKGIKESIDEEKSLLDQRKEAAERKKDGKMSAAAYNEYIRDNQQALLENKIERIEAYREFRGSVQARLDTSSEAHREFVEREKARREKIQHFANSDMEGMSASPNKRDSWIDRFVNSSFVRFFTTPLSTFDQMLRLIGRKSVNGEGYLHNYLMNGWREATENTYLGVKKAEEVLNNKVSEVFGEPMHWSDLYDIERKMPKVKVTWFDDGEMKEHELTQGNLLYIYMVNKMADGRMKLRRMGITDADVKAIERQMDDRFLRLADWIQDEFLVNQRNKYNAVHERLFGAPMAAIDNYFPLKINKRSLNRKEDIGNMNNDDTLPSTTTGSIIKRRRNSQDLDLLNADAFSVVIDHINEMEKWAAHAEFNHDINMLLSYKKFRNRLQNMATVYGSGKTLWKTFRNVCRIAGETYHPAVDRESLDAAAVNIAKGVTGAKISFRAYTALKQLLSMPAFVADANIMYLGENMVQPWKAWNWAMDNLPMLEKRWRSRISGETRLMETESDWKFLQNKVYKALAKYGMTPNAFVDAVTISIGARAMYQTKYDQYIKEGYPEDKADKKAKHDATVLYNETQQSNEGAFVSPVQLDRTLYANMLTVFRNASMGYQRQLHDALRNLGKMMKKGYKDESVAFMTKQMMRDGLTEEQAEHAANRRYEQEKLHTAVRIGTFGFLVQFAWNLGSSLVYLLFGDDDDKKKAMLVDAARHAAIGGFVEGLAGGNIVSDALDMVAKGENLRNYDPSLLPILADIKRTYQMFGYDKAASVNELFNLAVQAGIGVNPQTLTDAVVAVVDACGGDLDTSKEALLLFMRVMQVPQSQLDDIYIDELGVDGRKASKMKVKQMAERYAKYKVEKGAPLSGWAYPDELEEKREKAYIKKFNSKVKERNN